MDPPFTATRQGITMCCCEQMLATLHLRKAVGHFLPSNELAVPDVCSRVRARCIGSPLPVVCKAIRHQERRLEDNGSNKEALSATLSQFWAQSQPSSSLRPSRTHQGVPVVTCSEVHQHERRRQLYGGREEEGPLYVNSVGTPNTATTPTTIAQLARPQPPTTGLQDLFAMTWHSGCSNSANYG